MKWSAIWEQCKTAWNVPYLFTERNCGEDLCNLRKYLRVQTILRLRSTVTALHMENSFKILLQGMQGKFDVINYRVNYLPTRFQGVHGWRSGGSTRLPPMWSGFDSQIRRQMWVEFVGSLLCTERFSPGTPVPLSSKTSIWLDLC